MPQAQETLPPSSQLVMLLRPRHTAVIVFSPHGSIMPLLSVLRNGRTANRQGHQHLSQTVSQSVSPSDTALPFVQVLLAPLTNSQRFNVSANLDALLYFSCEVFFGQVFRAQMVSFSELHRPEDFDIRLGFCKTAYLTLFLWLLCHKKVTVSACGLERCFVEAFTFF